jgi:hypothetical protein
MTFLGAYLLLKTFSALFQEGVPLPQLTDFGPAHGLGTLLPAGLSTSQGGSPCGFSEPVKGD